MTTIRLDILCYFSSVRFLLDPHVRRIILTRALRNIPGNMWHGTKTTHTVPLRKIYIGSYLFIAINQDFDDRLTIIDCRFFLCQRFFFKLEAVQSWSHDRLGYFRSVCLCLFHVVRYCVFILCYDRTVDFDGREMKYL